MSRRAFGKMRGLTLVAAISLLTAGAEAAQFSADVVQTGPEGVISSGRLYVDGKRVRTENEQAGQRVVHIIDGDAGVELMVYPDVQKYMQRDMPPGAAAAPATSAASEDPCAAMPGATCRKLGSETVAGRAATKWEISMSVQGQSWTATHWIDNERGMPLRQESSDGSRMEMSLLGREDVAGRSAEKWQLSMQRADGQSSTSTQWYDPELKTALRQQMPGGLTRELRNVQVGPQPASLFTAPAGFTKVSPQQRQGR